MTSSVPILRVKNLTKKYKDFTAVDNVSFEVHEGEIVGFLGPNGAGKTTTIHMILSLLEPSFGSIEIFGMDLAEYREDVLSEMNFVAPYTPLPYNLTVYENLVVFALLYGIKDYKAKVEEMLTEFHLLGFRNQHSGRLSAGEQTRLALAKALLNSPKFLLLDEPTASLDPVIAWEIRNAVYEKMKEYRGAILWTSHDMKEMETMCDRIIFLSHGKIVAQGTYQNLRDQFRKNDLEEIFFSVVETQEKLHHNREEDI
jgi:ABC-2 type transport system ATP-binding protein